jgi:hypothetical protein
MIRLYLYLFLTKINLGFLKNCEKKCLDPNPLPPLARSYGGAHDYCVCNVVTVP